MKQTECQFSSLQGIAEGNAEMPPQALIVHLKRFLRRHLASRHIQTIQRFGDGLLAFSSSLSGATISAAKPVVQAQTEHLQAGDIVRVRSKKEIEETLDSHGKVKGCAYMNAMDPYCDTIQRVLKPMERFVDERELRAKKCKGLVLLEGVMCEGTTEWGRCDRSCFLFWREEWLEKIK